LIISIIQQDFKWKVNQLNINFYFIAKVYYISQNEYYLINECKSLKINYLFQKFNQPYTVFLNYRSIHTHYEFKNLLILNSFFLAIINPKFKLYEILILQ